MLRSECSKSHQIVRGDLSHFLFRCGHRDIRFIGFKEIPQCAAVRGRATIPKSPWKPSAAAGRLLSCPRENAAEAAVVKSVDLCGACSLSQVVHFLRGYIALEPVHSLNCWPETESAGQDLDFGEVKGQQHVKRRRSRRRRAQHSLHRSYSPIGKVRFR
jgi:predicted ATPase with chaperone activity